MILLEHILNNPLCEYKSECQAEPVCHSQAFERAGRPACHAQAFEGAGRPACHE